MVTQLQELPKVFKLQLDRLGTAALEPNEFLGQLRDTLMETIVLPLEKEGDLLEDRHVALGANVDRHGLPILANVTTIVNRKRPFPAPARTEPD